MTSLVSERQVLFGLLSQWTPQGFELVLSDPTKTETIILTLSSLVHTNASNIGAHRISFCHKHILE